MNIYHKVRLLPHSESNRIFPQSFEQVSKIQKELPIRYLYNNLFYFEFDGKDISAK